MMRLGVACALVFVTSCLKGEDAMTENEFCEEYARRECSQVGQQCGPSSCETVRVGVCRAFAGRVKVGRQYNPANADACLKKVSDVYAMKVITAQALTDLEAICSRVFQGMARMNDPCMVDYDCERDLICDKGRCGVRRIVAAGGGCANIGEICSTGEYCGLVQAVHSCIKRQEKGKPCSTAEPCMEQFRCSATCVDRVALGMPCMGNDDCMSGYCNPYGEKICLPGLAFAFNSDSCRAYMGGGPDAGP